MECAKQNNPVMFLLSVAIGRRIQKMCVKYLKIKNPDKINYRDSIYFGWLPSTDLNRGPIG